MTIERHVDVEWQGSVMDGKGEAKAGTGAFSILLNYFCGGINSLAVDKDKLNRTRSIRKLRLLNCGTVSTFQLPSLFCLRERIAVRVYLPVDYGIAAFIAPENEDVDVVSRRRFHDGARIIRPFR